MKIYRTTKSFFDLIISFVLLVLFFPFLIIFSLIITIELKQFPTFIQERGLTLNKYRFKIFKFRTIKDADKIGKNNNTVNDIFIKTSLNDKITPCAAWLRKTGIDEFPQLINIIFGQMSFIGPRPLISKTG